MDNQTDTQEEQITLQEYKDLKGDMRSIRLLSYHVSNNNLHKLPGVKEVKRKGKGKGIYFLTLQ